MAPRELGGRSLGGRSLGGRGLDGQGNYRTSLGGAVWWARYGTSAVYVSNSASNGYGLGDDTTGNGSKATPYLTISKAATVAAAGAVVVVNPSVTTYAESTSGVGYLNLPNKALAISGDITAPGTVTISGTGGTPTKVVGYPTSSATMVLANLTVDGTGVAASSITLANMTGLVRFVSVTFANNTSSSVGTPTGSGNKLSFEGCTFASTVATALSFVLAGASFASLSVTGCTFSQTAGACNLSGGNATSIVFTGNTFNGAGASCKGVTFGTSTSTLLFSGNSASGTHGGGPVLSIPASNTITAEISYNTGSSSNIYLSLISETSVFAVHHNNISAPSAVANAGIQMKAFAQGSYVNDNTVTVSGSTALYGILVGTDGYPTDSSNATATGTQNLGDVSGNTYVSEGFKTTAGTTNSSHVSNFAGFLCTLKKVGSPTGTITAYLYSDNAGVPGTLIATSDTSLAANSSLVTTSAQQFFFIFTGHPLLTPLTTYHFVLKYTGTNDGTNYMQASTNATVTNGHASTSTDAVTWTADATHALLYSIATGCFIPTSIDVLRNSVIAQAGCNAILHSLLVGAINAPNVRYNSLTGAGGRLVMKDSFGGVAADNLLYQGTNVVEAFRLKGAVNAKVYQNTVVLAGVSAFIAAVTIDGDTGFGVNYPPSTGYDVQNNIFKNSGGGYVYNLQASSAGLGTINHNDAWQSGGAGIEINTYTTWGAWQGAGYDVNGVNANPQLASASPTAPADFVPAHASPAAGIGADLSATVPSDYNGVAFPNPPPAGALNVAA